MPFAEGLETEEDADVIILLLDNDVLCAAAEEIDRRLLRKIAGFDEEDFSESTRWLEEEADETFRKLLLVFDRASVEEGKKLISRKLILIRTMNRRIKNGETSSAYLSWKKKSHYRKKFGRNGRPM